MSGASVWDEGGTNRTYLHIAGGALIGGLGGGSAFGAIGGAAGAGLSSKLAGQLESLSKGVASETGSELLGNLAANVAAGVGGVLVGGTAGAATASNVELYNQMLHQKKKDLLSQACGEGAQCSDAMLNAVIQAQGELSGAAADNVAQTGAAVGLAAGAAAAIALGPEAYAAYKAAQAAYSLTTGALTGATSSGGLYTASAAYGAYRDYKGGQDFGASFNERFSAPGLAAASTFGAINGMFKTSMFSWAGVANSAKNVATVPGFVIQANGLALSQTAGKAAQSAVQQHNLSQ
ncbi:hypothetical protein OKW34_005608 [Paraburkholderia youngii]|uniref:hypothetical protein n=1 Tax=Paraburkholderia youngii TaxID=2782701 RepID=UPI003D1D9BC0